MSMSVKRVLTWTAAVAGVSITTLAGAAAAGYSRFSRQIAGEISALTANVSGDGAMVTEEMLDGLPEPVRRYLSYTGVVGRPMVRSVYLHQSGAMHPDPGLPWIPLEADQYYSVDPPGFIWDGKVHLGPLPLARGRDRFHDGRGNMLIKLFSLFPVIDATGPEMDQGSMMRHLSEMIWFPAAFLAPNVSFDAVDEHSARVTLTDHGRTVSATMFFDDEGRVTNLVAERYRSAGSAFELATWETPIAEYGEFEGLKLPVRGQAVWKLPEGDFPYIDVKITGVKYNQSLRSGDPNRRSGAPTGT